MKYTQGQSVQKIVEGGDSLWVYTDDTATVVVTPENVSANAVTTTVDRTDGVVKYGPYYKPTVINVTATSLDADVRNYEFIANPTTEGEFGEVMAATGGMTPSEIGSGLEITNIRKFRNQKLVTVLGNSISARTNNYATWMCRKSNGSYVFLKNSGVGGDTSADIIARMDADVPSNTDICLIMEATNDAINGVTVEQHLMNMQTIELKLKSRGINPVFVLAPPNNDPVNTDRWDIVRQMNEAVFAWCFNNNINCFDIWSQFSSNDGTGAWQSGASDDGTHPNPSTEQTAGYTLLSKIENDLFSIITTTDNVSGIIGNSMLLDENSGLPVGWTNSNATLSASTTSLAKGKQ